MNSLENTLETESLLKEKLINLCNKTFCKSFEKENNFYITIDDTCSIKDVLDFLNSLYEIETELTKINKNNIILNLKALNTNKLIEIFKISIENDQLCDSVMLLNVLNLIKTSNTLEDEFFEEEYIYFKNIEELVDIKLALIEELDIFIKKFSIYFISLFKSYNKVCFTPTDKHIPLPPLYKNLFLNTDMLTISGIFAISPNFSIDECIYIDNALEYLLPLQAKTVASFNLMNTFLESLTNADCNE